jgi:hypothetical protein
VRAGSQQWLPIKAARVLSKITDKYDLYTIYHKLLALQEDVARVEASLQKEVAAMQQKLLKSSLDEAADSSLALVSSRLAGMAEKLSGST